MTWLPRLNRQQQADRRREAARLLRQKRKKLKKAQIARLLGVSRAAVTQWANELRSRGLRGLAARPVPGRPSALTPPQWRQLLCILKRGAYAAGFPTDRWTLPRIQQIVKKRFDVEHSPSWLSRR